MYKKVSAEKRLVLHNFWYWFSVNVMKT